MKKKIMATVAVAISVGAAFLYAQNAPPPDQGPPPPPFGRHHPPPPPPVMIVLDANKDHIIDAQEIANASNALLQLDKNHDGQLTEDEFRPPCPFPGGPPPGEDGPPDGNQPPHQE